MKRFIDIALEATDQDAERIMLKVLVATEPMLQEGGLYYVEPHPNTAYWDVLKENVKMMQRAMNESTGPR